MARAASNAEMVIAGASERSLLARLVRGTPVPGVVAEVEWSVIRAKRANKRGVLARMFGRRGVG